MPVQIITTLLFENDKRFLLIKKPGSDWEIPSIDGEYDFIRQGENMLPISKAIALKDLIKECFDSIVFRNDPSLSRSFVISENLHIKSYSVEGSGSLTHNEVDTLAMWVSQKMFEAIRKDVEKITERILTAAFATHTE